MERGDSCRTLAVVALLLAPLLALAEPNPPRQRELRHRTLTIDDATLGTLPEIHVAGGSATVLTFQVPLKEGGAILTDVRDLFYPPSQTDKMVMLAPKADLRKPGAVNVSLADGTVLSFKLLSVAREADVQVDVILALERRASPDSAAALKTTVNQLRGQLDECQSNSASAGASKLSALLLTQNLDQPQPFERHPLHGGDKQNRLLVQARWVYRMVGLTYLLFTVDNRDPQRPWVLDRVEVRLTGGVQATDVKVIGSATELPVLPPDESERVVVAFATPDQAPNQRYSVTLVEKEGGRRVVLDGISP